VDFDPETRRFVLRLASGTSVEFDAAALWELKDAALEDLVDVGLSPSGSSITWLKLDVDISVDGLVMDLLGSPEWRRALRRNLNRELARTKTEARAKAARENGKKGDRPRKAAGL
jgi:hypothetical protein